MADRTFPQRRATRRVDKLNAKTSIPTNTSQEARSLLLTFKPSCIGLNRPVVHGDGSLTLRGNVRIVRDDEKGGAVVLVHLRQQSHYFR